jgi:glyoxylase-like metal-dependent hydrolase (beta-lactamase superfamily II)
MINIKGKIESFDIVTVGNQRINVYFGDKADNPPARMSLCTSTLIRGKDEKGKQYALLIDPSKTETKEEYYYDLERRTGLKPEEVTHCFCTHEHFDHVEGLNFFPRAKHMVAKENLVWVGASMLVDKRKLIGVEGEFLPGVAAVALPGHTNTLHGVAFIYQDKKYIVAGDAVVTKNHFRDETNNYEDDVERARETQKFIKKNFDFIIPGHDNIIVK